MSEKLDLDDAFRVSANGEGLKRAIALLKRGGLVAFPTDTVYGLGAAASCEESVLRIYRVKRRPRHKAIPLLIGELSQLAAAAAFVPEMAWRLAEAFLPGALTLVLKKAAWVSPLITAGGDTVALRMPNHPVALALIRAVGEPLATTSANTSGEASTLEASEVIAALGGEVDLVLDGGRCPGGVESIIIDLSQGEPRLLRRGTIDPRAIEGVLGRSLTQDLPAAGAVALGVPLGSAGL